MNLVNNDKKILCIFHHPCLDGMGSANIVRNFFGPEKVEMYPTDYTMAPPDMKGRTVYIVDFSYPPEVLLPAMVEANNVVMLDHHKGAIEKWGDIDLPDNLIFRKSQELSGIGVTWEFFYGHRKLPYLLQLLQDYDLYRFAIPGSREITMAMYARGIAHDLEWETFAQMVDYFDGGDIRGYRALFPEGTAIIKNDEIKMKIVLERNVSMVSFGGYVVPCINIAYEQASTAGAILCKGHPFAVMYEDWRSKGLRKYSLRSSSQGGVEVHLIAQMFGGSGNKHAAGITLPLNGPQPICELDEGAEYLGCQEQH